MRNDLPHLQRIIREHEATIVRLAREQAPVCDACHEPANARTRVGKQWVGLSCCFAARIVGRPPPDEPSTC